MIDLEAPQLEHVKNILAEHVPECEVRAFGSRVKGGAKKYSDIDLAIVGKNALDRSRLNRLEEAFENSDLPIRVDILDWHAISQSFQQLIERQFEVIQTPG